MKKKIAVIGATGRLAGPVVNELAKHYEVTAVVRNLEKAKSLPPGVRVVQADLQDVEGLKKALQGQEHLYLNLNTERPDAPFQPEYDGVANILEAVQGGGVRRIFKISGLGAYRPDFAVGKRYFANEVREKGHELIRKSGIAWTFFHPSWFMESLELMMRRGDTLNGFKPLPHPFHWIAGADYARMVARAVELNTGGNRDYAIQGPETLTMSEALHRYARCFSPVLKVRETPVGMLKFLGLFIPQLKAVGQMGDYFSTFQESFIGGPAWEELGKPGMRIEDFAKSSGL